MSRAAEACKIATDYNASQIEELLRCIHTEILIWAAEGWDATTFHHRFLCEDHPLAEMAAEVLYEEGFEVDLEDSAIHISWSTGAIERRKEDHAESPV